MNAQLTLTMRRVLLAIHRGQPLASHTRTQADYGGLERTILALRRRGLLDWQNKLTGIGLEAAQAIIGEKR